MCCCDCFLVQILIDATKGDQGRDAACQLKGTNGIVEPQPVVAIDRVPRRRGWSKLARLDRRWLQLGKGKLIS